MSKVFIDFGGFYESWHDDAIDRAIYEQDDDGEIVSYDEPIIPAGQAQVKYCREWLDLFNTELDTSFTFVHLESPREYNFSTDLIEAGYTKDDYNRVRAYIVENQLGDELEEIYREVTTERSGYIPFHSYIELFDHDNIDIRLRLMLKCIINDLNKDYPFIVEGFYV